MIWAHTDCSLPFLYNTEIFTVFLCVQKFFMWKYNDADVVHVKYEGLFKGDPLI